ncbi:MAG TPA: hypothetical protein VME43_29975, partial [Bryobacteraceae bacterium]|nr:hypothetical protein [Bryobacteraceae bacterium]
QLLPFLAGYAAWSPKRKTFAAARDDVLEFYREGRLIRQMRTPLGTSPMYPHWRPDGAHITFCLGNSRAYRSTLQLATPESDRMLPIARNEVVGDDQPFGSWTKDGRYFVFTAGSLELHDLWAVPDPASSSRPNLVQPRRLTNHSLNWRYPAPGNQTNELYAIGETRRPELVRLAADGGEWRPYLDRDGIPAYELDSSRDAQLVTYVSYPDYRLWISRADGTERHQLAWPDFEVHQPHWSPDGKRIAFMGKPEDKWRVEIVDVAMDHWQEPIPDGEDQGVPTWVDDNIIVYGDWPTGDPRQVMRLHVIDLQRRQSSVIPGSDGLWTVRCSPDGKYLSALRRDMTQRSNALLVSRWGSSDWREILSREDFAEQTWSRDSRHLQVMDTGELLRVDAFTGRAEKLADLHNFPYTSEQWFGIAPDGSPLALLSVQVQEIYSVSWRP